MNTSGADPIIGIDLGTTNSVVAGMLNGRVTVLAASDERIMPSIVGLDMAGNLVIGEIAGNQLAAFPERTVASIKRRMGTNDPVQLADQTFTPQEISAIVLRRLAQQASQALGQPVNRAVITVPAFFDENQRQATREAGVLAGLTVERIINEPTAATLVYHADSEQLQHIVVYDFGGGTFDVSIVKYEMGVVEVLSSKGDTQLGGDDLDQLLLDHVAEEFQRLHSIDLRDEATSKYRLLQACEAAKCQLSEQVSVTISEEFITEVDGRMLNLDISISRSEFEQMIDPLISRTIDCVNDALNDSGLSINDIDDLVLVGGSTRIPTVIGRLSDAYRTNPSRAVDPDLAVALGAATQAAMLSGQSVGPVLVDVSSHTLGIEVLDFIDSFAPQIAFSPLIQRNSPLPASFEDIYSTTFEDQEVAEIVVLQGENNDTSQNQRIGSFKLDLENIGENNGKIIVRFDLSLDGTLTVLAIQQSTGKQQQLVINNALTDFQSSDRENAVERLNALFGSENNEGVVITPASMAERTIVATDDASTQASNSEQYPAALALLQQFSNLKNIPADDVEDVESVSRALREAIDSNDASQVAALSEELEDILFYMEA